MSTEPENTANVPGTGNGATDGGPLRDRSARSAAAEGATRHDSANRMEDPATGPDSAGRTSSGPEGAGTDETGTRVIRTNSASSTDPAYTPEPRSSGSTGMRDDGTPEPRTSGSTGMRDDGDNARRTNDASGASADHGTEDHGTDRGRNTEPAGYTESDNRFHTAGSGSGDDDPNRTQVIRTGGTDDDNRTRAIPTGSAEDTSTRIAPVTASRDLPDETHGTDRRGRDHGLDRDRDDAVATDAALPNREALLAREKERFGGMKFGSAFFGWLTATGMVVLLSALAAAIGTAVNLSAETDLGAALESAAANQQAGIVGAIILLAVLLLSYYAGGYVAGRMARFNGLKQGLAVWLWALVAAAVVIILGLIYGNDIRSISQLNSVAPLPEDLGNVSAGAWIAVAATLVITLIGALLGGLAGMRFHRRIDRADFHTETATR